MKLIRSLFIGLTILTILSLISLLSVCKPLSVSNQYKECIKVYEITTFSLFSFVSVALAVSFICLTKQLSKLGMGDFLFKKTKKQINFVFFFILCSYFMVTIYDLIVFFTKVKFVNPNYEFTFWLLQTIFYFIWDLICILPILILHHV